MSVHTSNAYGKITVSEEAIAEVAATVVTECYGIVDLVSKSFADNLADMFKKQRRSRGVRVLTNDDRIFIDVNVIVKYGVSIDAVAQTLKKTVKYEIERFTGMVVDSVNVNIIGVRI